jgi:hypothetical protein
MARCAVDDEGHQGCSGDGGDHNGRDRGCGLTLQRRERGDSIGHRASPTEYTLADANALAKLPPDDARDRVHEQHG